MSDQRELNSKQKLKEKDAIVNLREQVKKIEQWLNTNIDKHGKSGNITQSNMTDNESAKMPTSHGVVQGYNGQAMVDAKRQVVVHAEAFGEGQEQNLLAPMIEGTQENFESMGEDDDVFAKAKLLADAGFHSEENMATVFENNIDAYIADNKFRQRDPQFADAQKHKKPIDRKGTTKGKHYFTPGDFSLSKKTGKLICPAGNELYVRNRVFISSDGLRGVRYAGWKTKCRACHLRTKCLRRSTTENREVVLFDKRQFGTRKPFTQKMIEKFDTAKGRFFYSRRMGIVEPVFGHIRHVLGFDWFTLRGKRKTDIQWKLVTMVHNATKLWRYCPRFAC
jgi:hypothetical protein